MNPTQFTSEQIEAKLYFVFDVKSIGLHGEAFAVGFVVVNQFGIEIQHGLIHCPPQLALGSDKNREWMDKNILPLSGGVEVLHPINVRYEFWRQYISWKERGAIIAADCNWPVEAAFLIQCVADNLAMNEWKGPYPLIDIGSVLLAKGTHPLQAFERLPSEQPTHNPLADARQSARILTTHLRETTPLHAQIKAKDQEITRLRDALKTIASCGPSPAAYYRLPTIAHEALTKPNNKTTEDGK